MKILKDDCDIIAQKGSFGALGNCIYDIMSNSRVCLPREVSNRIKPENVQSCDIVIAENAGFCSGVKRAINIAIDAAEKHGKAYTIGRLVHNNDAIRFLEESNVFSLKNIDKYLHVAIGSNPAAVIRSHGVGKDVYDKLVGHIYYDATCPYVKKIHNIVTDESCVIIAGDKSHPEVIGIAGHTKGDCFTVNSSDELKNLLSENKKIQHNALILVAQTTFNEHKWRDCIEIIKKHCTNAKIFDTICNATVKRQNQARELSGKCDTMLVIGSKQSSNSVKLYEICADNCKNTYFIENSSDINNGHIRITGKIGITAGASVPAEIIKEVHSIMSEDIKTVGEINETGIDSGEIDFMAEVDKTFRKIHTGKRVKAYVIAVNSNEAVVDLGTKHSGYIPADEIGGDPGTTPEQVVKPGDEIECIVTKINDAEGVVYLSKKRIDSELGYEKLAVAYSDNEVLEGYVASVVNSGVIVTYEGTRIFVPASQSGIPKTGKLEVLLKKTVKFKIIEINEQRKRLVGSIKAASRHENDAAKEKFWSEIEIGKRFIGEIKSMESYGVFVDLGGVDGMVHLSELTWKRVKHPKDAVSIGDKLEVFIKSYDPERKRVSLCAKNPDDNPWTKFLNEYGMGSVVKATVVNITPFGAFAQIIPGIDGLIHISQISLNRIKNVNEALTIGQEVDVQITEIDVEKERVSISIKALLEPEDTDTEGDNMNEEAIEVTEDISIEEVAAEQTEETE